MISFWIRRIILALFIKITSLKHKKTYIWSCWDLLTSRILPSIINGGDMRACPSLTYRFLVIGRRTDSIHFLCLTYEAPLEVSWISWWILNWWINVWCQAALGNCSRDYNCSRQEICTFYYQFSISSLWPSIYDQIMFFVSI